MAMGYSNISLSKCCSVDKNGKKKTYNEKVLQVEHCIIAPLVMSSNGGFGREYARFHSKLEEKIAKKR